MTQTSESTKKESFLVVEMPDGSKWAVPVSIIARSRAAHYAHEFDGDVELSLAEDTRPLLESDDYEIHDWAANNMNWSDVKDSARLISEGDCDYQDGWVNGEYEVVTLPSSIKTD